MNRFPINKILNNFRCLVDLTVKTRTLSYDTIPEKRVTRRDKIMQFHQNGLNSVQIANEMNRLGIKTPRGKSYTYKNIWVTIKKWKLREVRVNDFEKDGL